jgi:hypothetical protein
MVFSSTNEHGVRKTLQKVPWLNLKADTRVRNPVALPTGLRAPVHKLDPAKGETHDNTSLYNRLRKGKTRAKDFL